MDKYSSAQGGGQENIQEDDQCYTLSEIILVAFLCLLMGALLTTSLFVLYLKRTHQGCFSKFVKEAQGDSKYVKEAQVDSKHQSGPDMEVKFLTEKVVVKKKDPESADSKNENKYEETHYQSLNSNQIDNDQRVYDDLELTEPRSNHNGNEPRSGRLKQTGNDEQATLPNKTEGVYEYTRDNDLDGHCYIIPEKENITRESKASNIWRPETYDAVRDKVKGSTL